MSSQPARDCVFQGFDQLPNAFIVTLRHNLCKGDSLTIFLINVISFTIIIRTTLYGRGGVQVFHHLRAGYNLLAKSLEKRDVYVITGCRQSRFYCTPLHSTRLYKTLPKFLVLHNSLKNTSCKPDKIIFCGEKH